MRQLPIVFFAMVPITLLSTHALAQTPLEGAWLLTKVVAPDGTADTEPHRGLMLFTSDHYSVMHGTGDKPRALLDADDPDDTQIAGAYRSITANSGRYEVEGNRFTTRAYVAKNQTP